MPPENRAQTLIQVPTSWLRRPHRPVIQLYVLKMVTDPLNMLLPVDNYPVWIGGNFKSGSHKYSEEEVREVFMI